MLLEVDAWSQHGKQSYPPLWVINRIVIGKMLGNETVKKESVGPFF